MSQRGILITMLHSADGTALVSHSGAAQYRTNWGRYVHATTQYRANWVGMGGKYATSPHSRTGGPGGGKGFRRCNLSGVHGYMPNPPGMDFVEHTGATLKL